MKNDFAYVGKEKSIIVFNHSLPEDTVAFKYGMSDTEYIDLPAYGIESLVVRSLARKSCA